jgi:hypothetical protein
MGLGGLACAMLGAAVVLTDTAEVLPLLTRNYEANLSPAALRGAGSDLAGAVGLVEVRWSYFVPCQAQPEPSQGCLQHAAWRCL